MQHDLIYSSFSFVSLITKKKLNATHIIFLIQFSHGKRIGAVKVFFLSIC